MGKYEKTLKKIEHLEHFGIKLGLTNITKLCKKLGNPQDCFEVVHIAGTNGKGSVSVMIASSISSSGKKCGLYTSPHLQSFRERISINGRYISQEDTVKIFEQVEKANKGINATYFEVTTAMAFLYFKEKKCDFAVIETGLGGRLDATNIVKPKISVITNISLEHQGVLGSTRLKIAKEKAGIIKNSPVVTTEKDPKIRKIFGKPVYVNQEYKGKLRLKGNHQKINAALAQEALRIIGIEPSAIKNGLSKAFIPGRLEFIQKDVILDAAHNEAGMRTLSEFLKNRKATILLGISSDKNQEKMLRLIGHNAKKIIVTQAKIRSTDPKIIEKIAKKYCSNIQVIPDSKQALKALLEEKGLKVITGSIFLIGELRNKWKKIN